MVKSTTGEAIFEGTVHIHSQPKCDSVKIFEYTGAPVVGTPILGTHYIVSCDAEVCGAERESSRMMQGRMHWAVYFALLCFASGATLG